MTKDRSTRLPMRSKEERHNGARTKLYKTWANMKSRCYNDNHPHFAYYGGRGIKVCEAIRTSFPYFRDLVGQKPDPTYSLDRHDNNGHYSCGECPECLANAWPMNLRWASKSEQARNRHIRRVIGKSGYMGVHELGSGRWQAVIKGGERSRILGVFDDIADAANAYNEAALGAYGDNARLNEI